MPIDKLTISGFQAHEFKEVEFKEGLHTITGPSDSGKTAMLRALRWVVQNKPRGTAHINHNADAAVVGVSVDGRDVTRRRTPSANEYVVDGEVFEAVSHNVPEKVANVFNLTAINFQGQHDGPFWFGDTPAQRGAAINEIVDLGCVSQVLGHIGKSVRENESYAKTAKARLEEATAEKAALEWGAGFVDAAENCLALVKAADQAQADLQKVWELVRVIDDAKVNAREYFAYSQQLGLLYDNASAVIGLSEKAIDAEQHAGRVAALCDAVTQTKAAAARAADKLDQLAQLAAALPATLAAAEPVREMESKIAALAKALLDAQSTTLDYRHKNNELQLLEVQFEKALKEMGVCPLCGK